MRNIKKNLGFTNRGTGFRSVASEIGELIGHDFSPAVSKDKKMSGADLNYYVGDRRTILTVAPKLKNFLKQLPVGKILFFHCLTGSLTKEEICEFFNRVCTSVPFKLSPDDLFKLGDIPYTKGIGVGLKGSLKHTYYAFDIDQYEPTPKTTSSQLSNTQNKDIPAEFEKMKTTNDELQQADVTVSVVKKDEMEKYFRRDKTGLNKLDSNSQYMVFFVYGDQMDEDGIAKLSNDLTKTFNYSNEDVIKVGIIRKKYPGREFFENYDVFATKV